ncbi:MAG: hypothetical protein JSW01_01615, partial [Candidatus Bathyarchaeota archaeon]
MTHTNHRRGDRDSLRSDWVLLARVSRLVPEQREGAPSKFRELLKTVEKHGPLCLMARDVSKGREQDTPWMPVRHYMGAGTPLRDIASTVKNPMYVHAVFAERANLEGALRDIKNADLGISVVVSGLFDEVFDICDRLSTGPHTVNLSLGVMGKSELLPEEEILEITTMCGHAMISEHLTRTMIERVKQDKITPEDAGIELARQC